MKSTIPHVEFMSRLPVFDTYDLVVCGAGPAGIMAALAAGRLGIRTLLLDRNGFPGGVITAACCPALMGADLAGRQIVGGLPDEFVRELDRMGAARLIDPKTGCPRPVPIANAPLLGTVATTEHAVIVTANRLLREAGVECLFNANLLGAVPEPNGLSAAAVALHEGPALVAGRYFIDATGDAELVFLAGGRCLEAPADDSMTKTILIRVGGVENFNKASVKARFEQFSARGDRPFPNQDRFMGSRMLNPGEILLNLTLACGSALTSKSLTQLDTDLRAQVESGLDWLRGRFPEFAGCYLVSSAFQVGVRAGRCVAGLETITERDLDKGTPVPEPVALGGRGYGGHGLRSFNNSWDAPGRGVRGIPLGSLLVESFANVCAAGRSISAKARVLSSFRLTMRCAAIGQAAGALCALAARSGRSLREVPYALLREKLEADGALLHAPDHSRQLCEKASV